MNLTTELENARKVGLPKPYRRTDYERATDEMVSALQSLEEVTAIYRLGSIAHLGISDIDLVAVVDEPRPVRGIWPQLSSETRHLAMHTPFLIDRSSFAARRLFAHAEPLEFLTGNPADDGIGSTPDTDRWVGCEGAFSLLLRLLKYGATRRLNVRGTLCMMPNLRHCLKLGRITNEEAPRAWGYVHNVQTVRTAWFDRGTSLEALLSGAEAAIEDTMVAFGRRTTGSVTPPTLRMAAPWGNVTVAPTSEQRVGYSARLRSRPTGMGGRSRRGAELAWRASRFQVTLPGTSMAILHGFGSRELWDERTQVLTRYRQFMATGGASYSALGAVVGLRFR